MPDTAPPSAITTHCGAGISWCEFCGAVGVPLSTSLRPTDDHGDVCLTECARCAANPQVYRRRSAASFAAEHRGHLTRADGTRRTGPPDPAGP
ncbi:hypothetical protein [Pseudonocardia sp. HH130630-07]|uniref:hypothetical protein n=1 Tax=Pseudonocardia sp. HH130630-07 TaxID=1690815 RepID=UPI00081504C5|nr:hypothetical protein [Pseudonocardia sp. HH130630-07]ANY08062.1 hypothetical protein AFB00_19175 [Pseudonocardia sp. HH130630-07]